MWMQGVAETGVVMFCHGFEQVMPLVFLPDVLVDISPEEWGVSNTMGCHICRSPQADAHRFRAVVERLFGLRVDLKGAPGLRHGAPAAGVRWQLGRCTCAAPVCADGPGAEAAGRQPGGAAGDACSPGVQLNFHQDAHFKQSKHALSLKLWGLPWSGSPHQSGLESL